MAEKASDSPIYSAHTHNTFELPSLWILARLVLLDYNGQCTEVSIYSNKELLIAYDFI